MTTRPITGDTTAPRQPLLVVESEPERLFRIGRVSEQDTVVSTSMPAGPRLERASGRISLGALGVLADDVLGYAVLIERPADHWSVSTEISLDLCHPMESGSHLAGQARPVFADSRGAVTSGEFFDDQGRLVAVGSQHGRFVAALPAQGDADTAPGPSCLAVEVRDASSVLALLDVAPSPAVSGAHIDVVVTRELVNPMGNLHGGITICLADLVAITAMEAAGSALETASIRVAYLRPVPLGSAVTFVASVIHSGQTFAVSRVDVRNAEGKICAAGTVTASSVPPASTDAH